MFSSECPDEGISSYWKLTAITALDTGITGNESCFSWLSGCQDAPHFLSADTVFVMGMLTT